MAIRLDERYDDDGNTLPSGHVASRDIEVIVRDVASYSTVVQALVDAGITEISGVKPDVSDYDTLQRQALAGAVRDAREKADLQAVQYEFQPGPVELRATVYVEFIIE